MEKHSVLLKKKKFTLSKTHMFSFSPMKVPCVPCVKMRKKEKASL